MSFDFSILWTRLLGELKRDHIVWSIAGIVALLHLSLAGRYDFFRNELYFIICGRHPAFGYVDQPPLIPLLSAATQIFGQSAWLLRLPAVVAAVCIIPITAKLARLLGGGTTAAILAAVSVAIAPVLMALSSNLSTTTFEPVAWTALAYLLARSMMIGDRRGLIWAGCITGLALEAKYGILIWLIGLAIGLLLTSARRIFTWSQLWIGVGIAAVIALPNFLWQAYYWWPFLELVHNDTGGRNLTGTPLEFLFHQVWLLNPLLAPLWIAGVVTPFFLSKLGQARFLSIAFVAAMIVILVTHGKDYYLAGAYPTLFAIGAVACERLAFWWRLVWLAGAIACSALFAPVVLPILEPATLAHYLAVTHLRPKPDEVPGIGAPLTQLFSDELGWRALEKQVAAVYHSLPAEDRDRLAIVAVDYGEAAALDFFGAKDGLPPALCGQNQYYLWGTHGYDGSVLLHINGDPARWSRACDESEVVGHFGAPYVMPYENDRPIILCRGLRRNLTEVWPRFKRYN